MFRADIVVLNCSEGHSVCVCMWGVYVCVRLCVCACAWGVYVYVCVSVWGGGVRVVVSSCV